MVTHPLFFSRYWHQRQRRKTGGDGCRLLSCPIQVCMHTFILKLPALKNYKDSWCRCCLCMATGRIEGCVSCCFIPSTRTSYSHWPTCGSDSSADSALRYTLHLLFVLSRKRNATKTLPTSIQSLFDSWAISIYNIFFTGFPIFIVAVFDQVNTTPHTTSQS